MRQISVLLLAVTFTCSAAWAAFPAQAQSLRSADDSSHLWEAHFHLQKGFASPLGQRILEIVENENPGQIEKLSKFAEAIGLDPRTDIGEVVLFSDSFAETDVAVIARLGQSTGNLEGWMLAAPGYRSEDLDANTLLHSMTVEEKNARAWFALPKHSPSGNYVLVGSLDRDRTTGLAGQVLSGNPSPVSNPLEGNSILKFFINDLSSVPMEIDENEPGAAIVEIIEQLGVNVTSDSDTLSVAVDLSASSAGKARQISQLLTGLKAMIQLAPMDEPKAQKAAEILDTMVVEHIEGQTAVHSSLDVPYRLLEELIGNLK